MQSTYQKILSLLAVLVVFACTKGIGKMIGQSASDIAWGNDSSITVTNAIPVRVVENINILDRPSYNISIPATWHRIPQEYLDAFAAQMRRNPSINPQWAIYDSGFQKNSPQHGISPPVVLIKTDKNPKLAMAVLTYLNSMTTEQTMLTYDQALKQVSSDIQGIFDASVKNIRFDRKKKMLRFLSDIHNESGHIKLLTSIYIYDNTLYHVICTTLANIYNEDEQTFLQISNSFSVRKAGTAGK